MEKKGEARKEGRIELKPESPEILGFVPHVNQSFCTGDYASAFVGA